jgi:hypothetical protein
LLARYERGDESVEAFCAREGVSKSTFNRWRSRCIAPKSAATTVRISANVTGHFGIVTDAGLGGVARGEL